MLRLLLTVVFMIFLIAIIGQVTLEQFPSLVPLWDELKGQVVALYDTSVVKYGAGVTFMIIVAIVILVGSSKGI